LGLVDSYSVLCEHLTVIFLKVQSFVIIVYRISCELSSSKIGIKSRLFSSRRKDSSRHSPSIVLIVVLVLVLTKPLKRENIQIQAIIMVDHNLFPVFILVVIIIPHLLSINKFKSNVFLLLGSGCLRNFHSLSYSKPVLRDLLWNWIYLDIIRGKLSADREQHLF